MARTGIISLGSVVALALSSTVEISKTLLHLRDGTRTFYGINIYSLYSNFSTYAFDTPPPPPPVPFLEAICTLEFWTNQIEAMASIEASGQQCLYFTSCLYERFTL